MSQGKKFFVNAPRKCELPSFPEFTFRAPVIKQAREAFEIAAKADINVRPKTFANELLKSTMIEPEFSDSWLESLSEHDLEAASKCLAKSLAVGDEYEQLSNLPPLQRLFEAFRSGGTASASLLRALDIPPSGSDILSAAQEHLATLTRISDLSVSEAQTMLAAQAGDILENLYGGVPDIQSFVPDLPAEALAEITLASQYADLLGESFADIPSLAASVLSDAVRADDIEYFQDQIRRYDQITAQYANLQIPESISRDILISAGINSEDVHSPSYSILPSYTVDYDEAATKSDEELNRERSKDAYDALKHLESTLRKLVVQRLSDISGPRWLRQRVPQATRDKWMERKRDREDRQQGPSRDPIEYADLGDLKDLIVKKDNWEEAFSSIFRSQEILEGEFIKMEPIRKDIAHSRDVDEDDFLFFINSARWFHVQIRKWHESSM